MEKSPGTPYGQRSKRTKNKKIRDITKYVRMVQEPHIVSCYRNRPRPGTAMIRTGVMEVCWLELSTSDKKRAGKMIG